MEKLSKLLNRHGISFKVESNLSGHFIKSTTSATHYNFADEIVNELNEIKRGQENSHESAALPLHDVNASTSIECTDGEHHFYEVYFVNSDKEPFELDCIKCLECGKIDTDI